MLNYQVVTPPTEEPVSLTTAKLHLRVDGSTDDALIGAYIVAAREKAEGLARRAFVTQTLRATLDAWPVERTISLPRPPLQSVSSIKYIDANGAEQTLGAGDYVIDTGSEPGRLSFKSSFAWPGSSLKEIGAIGITFVAGYGAAAAVPELYKQAILLILAFWYENREIGDVPAGIRDMLVSERVVWF
jgi:uncharacterized phiE125 gp8 family phage protein